MPSSPPLSPSTSLNSNLNNDCDSDSSERAKRKRKADRRAEEQYDFDSSPANEVDGNVQEYEIGDDNNEEGDDEDDYDDDEEYGEDSDEVEDEESQKSKIMRSLTGCLAEEDGDPEDDEVLKNNYTMDEGWRMLMDALAKEGIPLSTAIYLGIQLVTGDRRGTTPKSSKRSVLISIAHLPLLL